VTPLTTQRPAFTRQLAHVQQAHRSLLCVGLDPEPAKFPGTWRDDPSKIAEFCNAVVDATHDLVLAFKPQVAYFAAHRAEDQLERVIAHIRRVAPEVPVILDAKRGDIGSTAEQYAREAFVRYDADAVTLSPYMGHDTIEPYLRFDGRGVFLLCRTSNPGGDDLQSLSVLGSADGEEGKAQPLYLHVARLATGAWNQDGRVGLVVGATYPDELPHAPLLVPGVGAQGGDAQEVVRRAWRHDGPVAVNSSRAILYGAPTVQALGEASRAAALATREALKFG
jgi:orotidine-5'-phosphate decarboxylase